MSIALIVPAAGSGERLGGVAKPFLQLAGEPMLVHALRPFLRERQVACIVVALRAEEADSPPAWLIALDSRIRVVRGGAERGDSVLAALEVLPGDISGILIHDAARPLVTPALVARALAAVADGRSAAVGVPVTDTIQQVDDMGRIVTTPDRSRLWQAQTPQAFPHAVLIDAYRLAGLDGVKTTDDASLVARTGETVHMIEGDPENLKVTTPADLIVAGALLASRAQNAR